MSTNDTLRGLLLEAKDYVNFITTTAAGGLLQRIDAALAEPVAGHPEPEYWPLGVGAIAHTKAKAAGCDFEDCMHDAVQAMLAELRKAPAKAEPVAGQAVVLPEYDEPELHSTGSPNWHSANAYNQALDDVAALNGGAVARPVYGTYTTTPGESVAGIAHRQLKDESRWVEIRDLNAHAFPAILAHEYYPVGTVLRMPAKAGER